MPLAVLRTYSVHSCGKAIARAGGTLRKYTIGQGTSGGAERGRNPQPKDLGDVDLVEPGRGKAMRLRILPLVRIHQLST
jgi:hypothetical protein